MSNRGGERDVKDGYRWGDECGGCMEVERDVRNMDGGGEGCEEYGWRRRWM